MGKIRTTIRNCFVFALVFVAFNAFQTNWCTSSAVQVSIGQNQSAHYLTIDEQERTRAEKAASDIQDALDEAEREADNTVLAKFIRNLESRIYSTLAEDISESLFNYSGIPTIDNPIAGEINLEGNILKWINDGITITLIIEEWFDGIIVSTTEIIIPVGSFGGCWVDCDG